MYSHAYSVLNVFEVKEHNAKLVKLRNPRGDTEWKGAWDKKDSRWTNELKALAGYTKEEDFKKDDGIFCIEINDFLNHFT